MPVATHPRFSNHSHHPQQRIVEFGESVVMLDTTGWSIHQLSLTSHSSGLLGSAVVRCCSNKMCLAHVCLPTVGIKHDRSAKCTGGSAQPLSPPAGSGLLRSVQECSDP